MLPGTASTHSPLCSLLRRVLQTAAVALCIFLGTALAAPLHADAAVLADRIVAVVNTELIMLSELKAETEATDIRLRAQYRGADLDRRIRQTELETLTRMIETRLQLQIAKTRGVEAADEEVQSAIKEMQRQGEKLDGSNPAVQRGVREQIILLKVVDREVRSNLMVAEIELQRYYMQHQSRFLLPDEYRISQILLVPRAGEDRAQVRARAQAAYAELKQGAQFADMVMRYSDGPEATKGGALGFVRQGELLPPSSGPSQLWRSANSASRSRRRRGCTSSVWTRRARPAFGLSPKSGPRSRDSSTGKRARMGFSPGSRS